MRNILNLLVPLFLLILACNRNEPYVPDLPGYGDIGGDNQRGYILEPLPQAISIDVTDPFIHRVEYKVTKGGGEVLYREHIRDELYFWPCSDSALELSYIFRVKPPEGKVTLCNKWLLGCEEENEVTAYLYDTAYTEPVDTVVFTAMARKREVWNRSCGFVVFRIPQPFISDFGFDVGPLDIDPDGDIWVLNSYPVYRSTDGGESFSRIYNELLKANEYSIDDAAIAPNGRIFFGTRENGIILSDDKGENWRYGNEGLSSRYYITRFIFLNDTEYLCNSMANGIFYSEDAGDHWTLMNVKYGNIVSDEYLSVVKSDSAILMIDEHRNLIRSMDRGRSWELLHEYIPDYHNLRELVEYQGAVFAKTEKNSVYSIFRSEDLGETWTKIVDNECYNEVNAKNLAHPDRLFYYVDKPCNPLYDANKIYYIDADGRKGTLIDEIPDIGFQDFIILENGRMVLFPSQAGGIYYNN